MLAIDFLSPNAVLLGFSASSKRSALKGLSIRAGELTGMSGQEILNALWERESIGSTAIGHGIAVPHGRLRNLQNTFGLFARLAQPIDFEAMDKQAVDLIFALLVPGEATRDSLMALASISRKLRNAALAQQLREIDDASRVHQLLTSS
jgi:PTS system nitrogen regulatory IIA component